MTHKAKARKSKILVTFDCEMMFSMIAEEDL